MTATSREIAICAAQAADAKKACDLVVQDVSELLKVTDYFVLATGANPRQVLSIVDEVEEVVGRDHGVKPIHIEGLDTGGWVLMDYGNIVVHVFLPEVRDYYRLETLWADAPTIDLVGEGYITLSE